MKKQIVTRCAPSNTGNCHIGTLRTALFSYLVAKQAGGLYCTRFEDTDQARSTQAFADNILESFKWLGIESDVPIVYQSQRGDIYKKYIQQLLDEGKAYRCYCSRETLDKKREELVAMGAKPLYDKACLGKPHKDAPYVVRFKTPDHGRIVFKDLVFNRVDIGAAELSDFIIQRQDGSCGYLLANVLDDHLQGISHIIRGLDGLQNAPAQILLYQALGFPVPTYGHTPFILAPSGEKLSKRNGDASALDYRDKGYLNDAMANWLVRLGWSHGNDELFTMPELIEKFNIKNVSKHSAMLDMVKLTHIQKHHMKIADTSRLVELVKPFLAADVAAAVRPDVLHCLVKILQPRSTTLVDMAGQLRGYIIAPKIPALNEDQKFLVGVVLGGLDKCDFSLGSLNEVITKLTDNSAYTMKDIGPVLRLALTGKTATPPVVEVLWALGPESVSRLSVCL